MAQPDADPPRNGYPSTCAGCAGLVAVYLGGHRRIRGPHGCTGTVSYADADIAVWDCPACGATNADALNDVD